MEKIIQELEAKRAAARRGYLICAAMGVALVVMLGTHQYTRALAVLALTVIVYLLLARQDIKGFSDAYRKAAAQAAMGKWLEDAAYHGKEGSPPQQLRDARSRRATAASPTTGSPAGGRGRRGNSATPPSRRSPRGATGATSSSAAAGSGGSWTAPPASGCGW